MREKWWEHKNMRVVRNVFFKCDPKVATHKARFLLWSEKYIYTLRDLLCKHTFLGLLAKIKCSICSYQFNIWYTGNAQYSILNEFFWGATTELCLHSGSKDGHGQAQRRGRPPLSLHSAQFVEEWFPIQRLITFCCLRTDDYTFSSAFFVRMFQPGWNPEHLR